MSVPIFRRLAGGRDNVGAGLAAPAEGTCTSRQSRPYPYNMANVGEPLVGSRRRVQDPPLHRQGETG